MKKILPILYAEDNENDIELTLSALKECNLQNKIDVVRDGQQVLDYLNCEGEFKEREKVNPLMVLLDNKMPKLDGIQVLQIIKTDLSLKTIPVVMLTSSEMETDIAQSYNLGVNAYVVKPIDFEEFIKVVKEIGIFWALVNKNN